MTADMALTLSGLVLELTLVAILIGRRVQRSLLSFVCYVGVALCTDALASGVPRLLSRDLYLDFWIASLFLEFACFIWLTVELGRNILRHNHVDSPNWFLAATLFVPAVWGLTLLSHWTIPPKLAFVWRLELRLSQATAVLSLAAFLAMIWWTTLRQLHWAPREFRIAVGIGIEALVGFVAVIIHTHQPAGPAYHWVDVSASFFYLAVLVYWVQYFAFGETAMASNIRLAAAFTHAGHSGNHDDSSQMTGASRLYRFSRNNRQRSGM